MATMVRGSFADLFLSDMLPAIHELIYEKHKSYPDKIPFIFNMEKSDRDIEQTTTLGGFDTVPQKPEGSPVSYSSLIGGYDQTYTFVTYALGFSVSKEMMDDEKYGLIRKAAVNLARSMFNTKQILAANIFNRAFNASYTGPDGATLCSTSHTIEVGSSTSNRLAADADLSVTSLRSMINLMEDTVGTGGLLINLEPRYLLVPNELEWDAEELLKSSLRPDNANMAVNAFAIKKLEPLVWNYLTDSDAWFLISDPDENGLYWWDREPDNVSSHYDFDTDAGKTKIRARFDVNWSDWRGVCGTPGA